MLNRNPTALVALFAMTVIITAAAKAAAPSARTEAKQDGEWIDLFNGKDLAGWHLVLGADHKGIDPANVFQVHDGVMHVYRDVPQGAPVPVGYLATDESFSSYHLKLDYRWVGKRFAPRVQRVRDAGILYHASSQEKVWPRSIECQIQEGDVGDCFLVGGTQVTTTLDPRRLKADQFQFLPATDGGVTTVRGGPGILRIIKSSTHENEGWNTVEVIIRADQDVVHIVNGHEVFRATKLQQLDADGKTWVPIKSGHILLQCEFAEVQYRDVRIKPLEGRPFRVANEARPTEAKRAE